MGTRSVVLGADWQLLGATPLEVEMHGNHEILVTVAEQLPQTPSYPAQKMRGDYAPNRVFDTPNMNVYGRSSSDDTSEVVVVPRASMADMLAALSGTFLTLDPSSGDVFKSGGGSDGS